MNSWKFNLTFLRSFKNPEDLIHFLASIFRTPRFYCIRVLGLHRFIFETRGGLFVYQYYTWNDLNIGCINDTLRGRPQVYRARICQAYYQRYGMIRLYCVVLITTISHGVRELQRGLQFRSVDNHRTVVRYFSDSRRSKSFSPAS